MQIKSQFLRVLFFVAALGHSANAPIPSSMSAIGDSTTTATLAQYKRSQVMNPFTHVKVLYEFLRLALTRNKQSLSDWKYSWSTGLGSKKVYSHAARLRKLNPKLAVTNFAEPGANIEAVWKYQIPRLKEWSQKTYKKNYPDYVTLMAGANDICAESLETSTSIKSFTQSYSKILNEILSSSKSTRILVNALPPYQELLNSRDAHYLAFPGLSKCGGFWKIAPLCKSITHGGPDNQEKIAYKTKELNIALKGLINSLRKVYGDRLRLGEKVASRHIHKEDLSIDCFHPNANAQGDLAELSWASTWWAQ